MTEPRPRWNPTLGAVWTSDSTRFRVWAPRPQSVVLLLRDGAGDRTFDLHDVGDGYREITLPKVTPGAATGTSSMGRARSRIHVRGSSPAACTT